MCGIAGAAGPSAIASRVNDMLDRIAHRGPDGRGVQTCGDAIHGHVRLALVDLSEASAQPFRRGATTLSYNGELWNWRALRRELEAGGGTFATNGDTEVLAAALEAWGEAAIPKLEGMFAFAWSSPRGTIVVRDRYGKVPAYVWRFADGTSLWASERKAFQPGLVPLAIPAGHVFRCGSGAFEQWHHAPASAACPGPEALREALRESVAKRLDADAAVCCLLSGGLDSSLVCALAAESGKEIVGFTLVCDPDADDVKFARRLASDIGLRLVEVKCQPTKALASLAVAAIEIPSNAQVEIAIGCLPLAEAVRGEGFAACLSGEGADELFCGYGNDQIAASGKSDAALAKVRRDALRKMARGNFVRCNKVFMAKGVECRLPFMEDSMVEGLVSATRNDNPPGKKLLKQAAAGIVPDRIVKRPKDTLQGGAGIIARIAAEISDPARFYRAEAQNRFGYVPGD